MRGRHLVRTGAFIVVAQASVALLGVLGLRLYTGMVDPAVFGTANLVLSALGLGLQLFVGGIVAAQLRFYSEADVRGEGVQVTRETMTWALRATAVLAGLMIVVLLSLRAFGIAAYAPMVGAIGAAWLFATGVRNVLMSRIQAQRRQVVYATLQVVEAVLLFGVTLAALHVAASVEAFLLGQLSATTLLLLLILILEIPTRSVFSLRIPKKPSLGKKAWTYGAPFAPLSFLSWLANLGDRYTLAWMLGSEVAGRYIAPFSIASRGMMLANSALCDLFRPILFDAENRYDAKDVQRTFVRWLVCSVALSVAGLIVVYLAGGFIAQIMLAPAYRPDAVTVMLWVSLGYAVSGITQIVENRLLSLGHSARLLLPMIVGAIGNVGFSLLLIRSNGIVGAAQATCASFILQNLATTGFLVHALSRRHIARAGGTKIEPA